MFGGRFPGVGSSANQDLENTNRRPPELYSLSLNYLSLRLALITLSAN